MTEKDSVTWWSKVIPTEGCWHWTGLLMRIGYGQLSLSQPRRKVYAHRMAYEMFRGPIPVDREIDHLCRNRACVNPNHLEAVTHQENIRRGFAIRKSCPKGHLYDESNTSYSSEGHRRCRECNRLRAVENYKRGYNR